MREVGAFEAKNTLESLLDLVATGQEVVITRRGRPVARLVPHDGSMDREKAHQAIADIISLRRGKTLGSANTLRNLIAEGRM
jgi:prevent-host-death family protein